MTSGLKLFSPPVSDALLDVLDPIVLTTLIESFENVDL